MRPASAIKILLMLVAILITTSLFAADKAYYYRGLYATNPHIKVEKHESVVYSHLDPNRSDGYTCRVQKVIKESVGMVCDSPDGTSTISCTVSGDDLTQYFC